MVESQRRAETPVRYVTEPSLCCYSGSVFPAWSVRRLGYLREVNSASASPSKRWNINSFSMSMTDQWKWACTWKSTLNRKPPMDSLHQTSSAHLQATDFLFHVFAAAVVSWGDRVVPLLLGVRAAWLPWQPGPKPQLLKHSLYGDESHVENALPQCLLGMPLSLAQLLGREPWSSQTNKVGVCSTKCL